MLQVIDLEWGSQGIHAHPEAELYVIIDVLSFSTCVDIALSRSALIFPYPTKPNDAAAQAFANQKQAILAGPRQSAGPSLSPASLQNLSPGTRLVLPSPNGSNLSTQTGDKTTVCACLRNISSVAQWLKQQEAQYIQVIAAGERWPDGSLRPALEDWLGAGALILELEQQGRCALSAEAEYAKESFAIAQDKISNLIFRSVSGRELTERGFATDVELACQSNSSPVVPLFMGDHYCPAPGFKNTTKT